MECIRKDLIEFIEKFGFIVSSENNEIKMKDAKRNNKLLITNSNYFEWSNGTNISLLLNCVSIKLNENITLRKEGLEKLFLKYSIEFKLDDFKTSVINFYCNSMVNENLGRISVELINYGKTREQKDLDIILKNSGANIYCEKNLYSSIAINDSNSNTYIKIITDFLNKDEFIFENSQIQEYIKTILSFLQKDIETMFPCEENIKNKEQEKIIKKVL